MKTVKNFIRNLLSGKDETSHKRVIALGSFFVLVGMVLIKAKGHPIDSNLIYVFASLCGGSSVLTVIEKFRKL